MKVRSRVLTAAIAMLLCGLAAAPRAVAAGGDAAAVLKQMDEASSRFKSAQADFEWRVVQRVVPDEPDVQKGSTAFRRAKDGSVEMVARVRELNGKPDLKDLLFQNGQLQYWQPTIRQWQVFSAGKNRGQYESFLTLGFGGSGSELEKNWTVTDLGSETIAGTKTEKLELVPKQESVRKTFTKVTIWVDPARALSLKQVFEQPSGDTRTVLYSNIRYNVPPAKDAFTLKIPAGVKPEQH